MDAASIIAAFLARWKHTHLHDRDSYDSNHGATVSSVKRGNGRRFHSNDHQQLNRARQKVMSFNLQLERFDQFRPAAALLLRKGDEFIEALAHNFDAHLFHALDKSVTAQ